MPQGKYPRRTVPCSSCERPIDPRHVMCVTCSNQSRKKPPLPPKESPNPSGLCHCGCGQTTSIATWSNRRFGYVRGHHIPYVRGHNTNTIYPQYTVDRETGCWIWRAGMGAAGYGMNNSRAAHRVMYERHKGPIPDGLVLDHLCRNPPCVNPDHLEPVTPGENTRRGNSTRLTWEIVREIRSLRGTQSQRSIAQRFGISQGNVSMILANKVWPE